MMKRDSILKITLFLMFILIGCTGKEVEAPEPEVSLITWDECGYEVGDHLCDFTAVDQNGNSFNLYENVGRPIIIDYSTMWCGYCQRAAQEVDLVSAQYSHYNLLYATVLVENQYGDAPTVSDCSMWASVNNIVESPVLTGDRSLIGTPGQNDGVPVQGWPTFLFLSDDLKIQSILAGFGSSAIDQRIQLIVPESQD
jgi:thiol-disulfide isomerase/thioredoxin